MRIEGFFSIDPLAPMYPFYSPYVFSGNRVLDAIELEGLEPELVIDTAEDYIGTPYEYGGKNPAFQNSLPNNMTEDWYLQFVGWPSSRNGSRYNNPNYTNHINLNQYLTNGLTSCGIDCSGLAGTSFNADQQKLMANFNLYTQNAAAQKQSFLNAESTNDGFLGTDFNNIHEGDIVFNASASHVMVATGEVRTLEDGRIQVEVIHAPQTGEYVEQTWKTVRNNWSFGHSFRTTDIILNEVEIIDVMTTNNDDSENSDPLEVTLPDLN